MATAIPPLAPASAPSGMPGISEAADQAEDKSEGMVKIKCAALDCVYNKSGLCTADQISVGAGPGVECQTYQPRAGGSEMPAGMPMGKAPMPPMPASMGQSPLPGGMGAM